MEGEIKNVIVDSNAVFQAMIVTTISGLSTGIGGLLVVAFESPSKFTIGMFYTSYAVILILKLNET